MASSSTPKKNSYKRKAREEKSSPYSEVLETFRKQIPEGSRLTRSKLKTLSSSPKKSQTASSQSSVDLSFVDANSDSDSSNKTVRRSCLV